MASDKALGVILLIISIIVIIVYGWLVFAPPVKTVFGQPLDILVLKITGFVAVAVIFGILGWIGYTLATTPPPKPIEEIEKEIEEELKKLEKEMEKESGSGPESKQQ